MFSTAFTNGQVRDCSDQSGRIKDPASVRARKILQPGRRRLRGHAAHVPIVFPQRHFAVVDAVDRNELQHSRFTARPAPGFGVLVKRRRGFEAVGKRLVRGPSDNPNTNRTWWFALSGIRLRYAVGTGQVRLQTAPGRRGDAGVTPVDQAPPAQPPGGAGEGTGPSPMTTQFSWKTGPVNDDPVMIN